MPWRRIGVPIAVVAVLIALGRVSERRGRLGVVLDDRLCRRLLDGVCHESRSLRGCLCGLDLASLGEWDAGIPVCVKAAAAAFGGVRSGLRDRSGIARAVARLVRTSAFAVGVAPAHPGRRARPRTC